MRADPKLWVIVLVLISTLVMAGCAAPANNLPGPASSPTAPVELPDTGASPTATTEPLPAAAEPASTPELAPADPGGPAAPDSASDNASIRYEIVQPESRARYRVQEQLANLTLPNDAVGETDQVSGAIVLQPDGSIDTAASRVVVGMSGLVSDSSRRDNFIQRNVLQTGQYPEAVFVPRRTEGLPFPPPQSGPVEFQLTGDLTIRDVTREVTWTVTGAVDGDRAAGQATTSFTFASFDLTQPRVPMVLSIEDEIRLELDLVLQGSGLPQSSSPQDSAPAAAAQPDPAEPAFQCTAPASLTPALTEGPYYTPGAPERTSLLEPGVPGTRLVLTGYVLMPDCQPVPGALLDFWQADGAGRYDNSGYVLRGIQYTDQAGRYELETVIPGEYPGRTPHIHVKVQAPGGQPLTSQVFFPDAAQNQTDRIFDQGLVVTYLDSSDGVRAAFDFVVEAPSSP